MTELLFDMGRNDQDGRLLHAMVLCGDRTIVGSLEGVLTQLPFFADSSDCHRWRGGRVGREEGGNPFVR